LGAIEAVKRNVALAVGGAKDYLPLVFQPGVVIEGSSRLGVTFGRSDPQLGVETFAGEQGIKYECLLEAGGFERIKARCELDAIGESLCSAGRCHDSFVWGPLPIELLDESVKAQDA
jgi:hypothetical protein